LEACIDIGGEGGIGINNSVSPSTNANLPSRESRWRSRICSFSIQYAVPDQMGGELRRRIRRIESYETQGAFVKGIREEVEHNDQVRRNRTYRSSSFCHPPPTFNPMTRISQEAHKNYSLRSIQFYLASSRKICLRRLCPRKRRARSGKSSLYKPQHQPRTGTAQDRSNEREGVPRRQGSVKGRCGWHE
jgi:hypothetical protein